MEPRSCKVKIPIKRAMLVYQNGLANVFRVKCLNLATYGRDAKQLMQGDFESCRNFARGLAVAGVVIRTAYCSQGGDITNAKWSEDRYAHPFSDQTWPLNYN